MQENFSVSFEGASRHWTNQWFTHPEFVMVRVMATGMSPAEAAQFDPTGSSAVSLMGAAAHSLVPAAARPTNQGDFKAFTASISIVPGFPLHSFAPLGYYCSYWISKEPSRISPNIHSNKRSHTGNLSAAQEKRKHVLIKGRPHAEIGSQTLVGEREYLACFSTIRVFILQQEQQARETLREAERVAVWTLAVWAALTEKRIAFEDQRGRPLAQVMRIERMTRERIEEAYFHGMRCIWKVAQKAQVISWITHDRQVAQARNFMM